MEPITYDPAWEATPAGQLRPAALIEVALHVATHGPTPDDTTDGITELDTAVHHRETGLTRRLRIARTAHVRTRLNDGVKAEALGKRMGISVSRVGQLAAGNANERGAKTAALERRRSGKLSVRDEVNAAKAALHAQVLADRAAARVAEAREYLERVEAGEPIEAVAASAGQSTRWLHRRLREARQARGDTQTP